MKDNSGTCAAYDMRPCWSKRLRWFAFAIMTQLDTHTMVEGKYPKKIPKNMSIFCRRPYSDKVKLLRQGIWRRILSGLIPLLSGFWDLMPKNRQTRNCERTYQSLYQDRTYRVDFNPKKTELMTLKLDYISFFVASVT